MLYFSNFVRTGNPNESPEPEHGGRQEKSRLKNIEWTPYETVHKKYLNLGECLLMISLPSIDKVHMLHVCVLF